MSVVPLQMGLDEGAMPNAWSLLDQLPDVLLLIGDNGTVLWTNARAEEALGSSRSQLTGRTLAELLGPGSALESLCEAVGERAASLREREFHFSGPPPLQDGVFDVQIIFNVEDGNRLLSMRERGLGERLEGLSSNRNTARSLSGLAAALAHEVKNPLSGIRGAAQLLATAVSDDDADLAHLIADEVDRVCALLDRMEAFSERHPMPREPLNIHEVLDHVARLARAGVARGVHLHENYDPSLPLIDGNRDALIQVFFNLVKNAAEAAGEGGAIALGTAYDGSVRHRQGGTAARLLPLVVTVTDNGSGIPDSVWSTLFDPFVSGSETRSGLGLSLVSKIIDSHGGAVWVDSEPGNTVFRVALPLSASQAES